MDIRRDFHRHPELSYQEHRTASIVATLLAEWGFEVRTGIAGTGVLGTLRRGFGNRVIALRADMDALPITEATGLAYASETPGQMHACGHDGHTTILLAAAHTLATAGQFNGVVHVFFQPAEETGSGARRAIEEGLLDELQPDAIFGLHNWPNVPAGQLGFVEGPAMAAVDQAHITIIGEGGHGAEPHKTIDPIVTAAYVITALQTVVSRNTPPLDSAIVSVGAIHGGEATNVIPSEVELKLTIRSFRPDIRKLLETRIPAIVSGQASSSGARANIRYSLGVPPVNNHLKETRFAQQVAEEIFAAEQIDTHFLPRTASEDFAYYLQKIPGSFVFLGNGDSAPLHNPHYDFNDENIVPAALYWSHLVERFLQA